MSAQGIRRLASRRSQRPGALDGVRLAWRRGLAHPSLRSRVVFVYISPPAILSVSVPAVVKHMI
jgi:hypothetical protein